MIVDDEPENLNVLSGLLDCEDWEVCAFPRGEMALAAAQDQLPDIVLMDVRMPGIDGHETCRRLKNNARTRDIPVLFLSALSEPSAKLEAFEAGGADYVTKPFHKEEVLARIRTHLALREHRVHLDELVRQRSQDLAEAHRRLRIWDDAKNQWLNLLSHEMRTPLTGIIGTAEILFAETPADSSNHALRNGYTQSVQRINKLIDDAILLTQIDVTSDEFIPRPANCRKLLVEAVQQAREKCPGIAIEMNSCDGRDDAQVEPGLLRRAFSDLLFAAACCVKNDEKIEVLPSSKNGTFTVTISTRGQSLPETDLETFFDIGGQRTLLRGGGDYGLSPALARRILLLFSGTCSIRNGTPNGLVIQAALPLCP